MAAEDRYLLKGSVLDFWTGAPFWAPPGGDGLGSTSVSCWLIDKGEVAGIDVSETVVVAVAARYPNGSGPGCRRLLLIEEEAPPEVVRWVVDAFQGRLGGPMLHLARLTGEQVGFYQVPISYRLDEQRCLLHVPDMVKATAIGRPMPQWHPAGSAAPWQRYWIGRSPEGFVSVPEHSLDFALRDARAVRGTFRFES